MTAPTLEDVPALLLAGGFGTRLRSVLSDRPKPLAPVNGRPFITYLLDQLVEAGVTRAVLGLHYQSEMIIEALGHRYRTLQLEYSIETEPLGTGGAIRHALPVLTAPRFLVFNADSFCPADLAAFTAFHRGHGCPASLLSVQVEDTSRYGRLEISDDARTTAFNEKSASSGPGPINAGIYLFDRSLIETIPAGAVSLERELFPQWISQGLMAWRQELLFIDIGTPESYAAVYSYLQSIKRI